MPHSQKQWSQIPDEFEKRWNYPHCFGAIDCKHVMIEAPPHSGYADYRNYKEFFSIVLFALVVANSTLICVVKAK